MAELPSPYEFVKHTFETVPYGGKLLSEWVEEIKKHTWISVEERLPEKDDKYIVCTAKGSVYCTKFRKFGKGGSFGTDINTHVTHWMPLPEPPKEGKK